VNPKLYNSLKFLAQVLLPALGTLYLTLAGLWDLPSPQEVAGTILAVDTFLGVVLHLQSNAFKANNLGGTMVVMPTPDGKKTYALELDGDPEDLEKQDQVIFKVNSTDQMAVNQQQYMKRS
jgi:hypothetical protein